MRMLWLGVLLMVAGPAMAEVYRCSQGKTTVFSDKPCKEGDAPYQAQRPIIVVPHDKAPDLAKQYDEREAREKKARDEENVAWNRDYAARKAEEKRLSAARAKRKVVQGMKADEVRRLMGEPTEVSRDEDRKDTKEVWTYFQDRSKVQVYLKDGVVTRTYHKKSRK